MILERSQHGFVQVLTLNRPEAANSLNPELIGELTKAFTEISTDDATRVVVVTAAVERVFCAGMDLQAFAASSGESGPSTDASSSDASESKGFNFFGPDFKKPVIAAVNGAAVGGGFELVLNCDLVVASESSRFGLPEVKRGLLAAGGGTLLGTRIPLAIALEIALTGEFISAAQAAQWGLVNRVVAPEQLIESALELAGQIAANAPLAIQTTRTLTRRAVETDPSKGWGTPAELGVVFGSEDAMEGAMAFMEKRSPNWKSR